MPTLTASPAAPALPAAPQVAAAGQGRAVRLSAPQLALVRCWAEGLDLCAAWPRFLPHEPRPDPRTARAAVARWRAQLAILARAHGQTEAAVLLRRDPEAMAERTGSATSLDEFRAAQPEDFYTEAELLALYQAEHGKPDARSAARRKQRLRQRLLSALQGLERLAVARQARSSDPLAQWLDERLAARLAAAGLVQVGDLLQHLQRHGPAWHRSVARVGAVAARRVEAWLLDAHRSAAEAAVLPGAWPAAANALAQNALAPNAAAQNAAAQNAAAQNAMVPSAVAPSGATATAESAAAPRGPGPVAEVSGSRSPPWPVPALRLPSQPSALVLPQWLLNPPRQTDAAGLARPPPPDPPAWTRPAPGDPGHAAAAATATAAATTAAPTAAPPSEASPATQSGDRAMLQAWLAGQVEGSATWRASRKECERYLLWARWVRGKPLGGLTPDDVRAYALFLRQPDAAWCGPRQATRHSAAWRPFEGALGDRSWRAATAVLRRFSAWLLHTGRQPRDPWHEAGHAVVQELVQPVVPVLAAPPATSQPPQRPAQLQQPAVVDAPGHLRAADLDVLIRWCAQAPDTPSNRRRLAVLYLVLDGLRLRELAQARVADLRSLSPQPSWVEGPSPGPAAQVRGQAGTPEAFVQPGAQAQHAPHGGDWRLQVRSPPGEPNPAADGRAVRLSAATQAALARHWQDRALPWPPGQVLTDGRTGLDPGALSAPASALAPMPVSQAVATDLAQPVVAGLRATTGRPRPVGESQLYLLLRQACTACADGLAQAAAGQGGVPAPAPTAAARPGDGLDAQARRLRAATPQALRLAAAAAALQQGARLRDVQQRLGHRSAASTAALLQD